MKQERNMGAHGAVQKQSKKESGVCLGIGQGREESPGNKSAR